MNKRKWHFKIKSPYIIIFSFSESPTHFFIVLGALTGAITTPLDVIKTRLMVQVQQCMLSVGCCSMFWLVDFNLRVWIQGSANQYKGIFDCVQTIVRDEGPSALLKVCTLRSLNVHRELRATENLLLLQKWIFHKLRCNYTIFKDNEHVIYLFLYILITKFMISPVFRMTGNRAEGDVDRHRRVHLLRSSWKHEAIPRTETST